MVGRRLVGVWVVWLVATMAGTCTPPLAPGDDAHGTVLLSEVHYHAASDEQTEEFVELRNVGDDPVDLGGWCFTEGITGCFAEGTILQPDGYLVSARDADVFSQRYGGSPDATHSGNLSNGGETLTLVDDSASLVFSCTYDDGDPWAMAPDGQGPSLERVAWARGCNDAAAWSASSDESGVTPGRVNSADDPDRPRIVLSMLDGEPTPGEPTRMLVVALRATSVTVEVRHDFGPLVTVELHDDGQHGDHAAGDGIFGGELPAASAGSLLRYRTVALADGGGRTVDPAPFDGQDFHAAVVDDGVVSDLPLLRWYMDPADFTSMTTEHLTDDCEFPAVIAIDGRVYDGASVKVKGTSSVYSAKKKFAFEMPEGHLLDVPWLDHPIDEFDLQAEFENYTPIDETPAWDAFEHFGAPTVQRQFVRVHKNDEEASSRFYGTYLLREDHDGKWREREGFEDGTFFKHGQENKTDPEAGDALAVDFVDQVTTLTGDDLRRYLLDHLDVPAYINFMAVAAVTQYDHWGWHFNVNQFVDGETGRWSYLPLDLDDTYDWILGGTDDLSFERLVEPTYDRHLHQADPFPARIIEAVVFEIPEFREMYFRRLVSVQEEIEAGGLAAAWYDAAYVPGAQSFQDDHQKWLPDLIAHFEALDTGVPPDDVDIAELLPGLSSYPQELTAEVVAEWLDPAISRELFFLNLAIFAAQFAAFQADGLLPASQPSDAAVELFGVGHHPGGSAEHGFLALRNPGADAVDLSGWRIAGSVEATLPNGAVVPAGGCAIVAGDDLGFRAFAGPGHLLLGTYEGELPAAGSVQVVRRDGSVAASLEYEPEPGGIVGSGCTPV